MTDELVSVQGAPGGLPGTLADQGYPLPPGLSYDAWKDAGLSLHFMHRNINWWIGDWLVYGRTYYDQDAYQAAALWIQDMLGRKADTVDQCLWVASRFPPPTRNGGLSWSHHRAVLLAGLDDPGVRAGLLETARADSLNVEELSDLANQRRVSIDATVQAARTAAGTPVPEPARRAPWLPTPDDLKPESRQACAEYAARARVAPYAAERIWALALYWAGARDAFATWQDD